MPEITRRKVLGGLLAMGAGAALMRVEACLVPSEAHHFLSREEVRIVHGVAEAMFHAPGMPSVEQAAVVSRVDSLLVDDLLPLAAQAFRGVLQLVEWSTMGRYGLPFSKLELDDRAAELAQWSVASDSTWRAAADALKAVLGMAYFEHPDVRAAIGWQPTCGGP